MCRARCRSRSWAAAPRSLARRRRAPPTAAMAESTELGDLHRNVPLAEEWTRCMPLTAAQVPTRRMDRRPAPLPAQARTPAAPSRSRAPQEAACMSLRAAGERCRPRAERLGRHLGWHVRRSGAGSGGRRPARRRRRPARGEHLHGRALERRTVETSMEARRFDVCRAVTVSCRAVRRG